MTLDKIIDHAADVSENQRNWVLYSTTHHAINIRSIVCRIAHECGISSAEMAETFKKTPFTANRMIRSSFNLPPTYTPIYNEIHRRVYRIHKKVDAKAKTKEAVRYMQRLTSLRKTPSVGFKFTNKDYKQMCNTMEAVDKFMAKYGKGEVARDSIWFGDRKYL